MAKTRDRTRDLSTLRRNWSPPDPYAPDDSGRRKIYSLLLALDANNADTKTLPFLVETVAIRTKSRPAEVLEVWKSMKERVNA